MPYGSNPRGPPPGQGYGAPQGYGGSQGYGGDPRMAQGGRPGGAPGYNEKRPSSSARQVPLRVEKVADKSLQSRLIYGNLYVVIIPRGQT